MQAFAQTPIQLWNGTGKKAKAVTLTPYLAETNAGGMAVIVCPGGSYCWLDMETEGTEVARWLQANGISAFVLKYRVQGVLPYLTHSRLFYRGNQYPDAQNDLQKAMEYVRSHAVEYGINPGRIGLMGFSAGGHLSLSLTLSKGEGKEQSATFTPPLEGMGEACPSFIAAIYPVVSMSHPDCHKRSRRALLGEYGKLNRRMRDSLSVEKHIPADCPPVFLVACEDDPVVSFHNAEMLDSALTAQRISHRFIRYRTGGHGFGASEKKGTAESRAWKQEFLDWLQQLMPSLPSHSH